MQDSIQKERGGIDGISYSKGIQAGKGLVTADGMAETHEVLMTDSEGFPIVGKDGELAKEEGGTNGGRPLTYVNLGLSIPLYGTGTLLGRGPAIDGLDGELAKGSSHSNITLTGPSEVDSGASGLTELDFFMADHIIKKAGGGESAEGPKISLLANSTAKVSGTAKLNVKGWKKRARAGNDGARSQDPMPLVLGKRSSDERREPKGAVTKKKYTGNRGEEKKQLTPVLAVAVEQPRQTL